jgi:hypothetical protein
LPGARFFSLDLEKPAAEQRKREGQKSGGRGKKKLSGKLPPSKVSNLAKARAAKGADDTIAPWLLQSSRHGAAKSRTHLHHATVMRFRKACVRAAG